MNKLFVVVAALLLLDTAHSKGGKGSKDSAESRGGKGGGGGGGGKGGGGGGKGGGGSSPSGSSADVYGFCVDASTWSVSYDGGSTFTEMYPGDSNRADGWSSLTKFSIGPITAETQLIVNCTHSGPRMLDYNGLFIASITFEGEDYFTSDPLSDSLWQCTGSSTGGDTEITVYCPKAGLAPQNPCLEWDFTGFDGEEINQNAYWVWNDEKENTLSFAFDFGDIPGVAMEQSVNELTLFERAYSVIDGISGGTVIEQQSLALLVGGGVFAIILVVMMYRNRRSGKDAYDELV